MSSVTNTQQLITVSGSLGEFITIALDPAVDYSGCVQAERLAFKEWRIALQSEGKPQSVEVRHRQVIHSAFAPSGPHQALLKMRREMM